MKHEKIAQTFVAQDGAIWQDFLFRFNHKGEGRVYSLPALMAGDDSYATCLLDQKEILCPHCNAVFFGKEKVADTDPFPVLYANLYNNYAKDEDRREGTLLAYRVQKRGDGYETTLVQIIRIGFVKTPLWQSHESDKRPYGNFVYLAETDRLCAFVMRDAAKNSRFFTFAMPALSKGVVDPKTGARVVFLEEEDLLSRFDGPRLFYLQGACAHKGLIYSTEGFGEKEGQRSALRIFDPEKGCQITHIDLVDEGLPVEPEWIDFYGDVCLYSDATGALYRLEELLG